MGTNYYFRPKTYKSKKINNINDKYFKQIEGLYEKYVNEYNKLYGEMLIGTEDLFETETMLSDDEWEHHYLPWLDSPELHICKISFGWKPLFQRTKYYKDLKSLKEFYQSNKDRICIVDEYGEKISLNNLIKEINERYKNQENQSHFKEYENRIYFDDKGYEWNWHEFS